MLLLIFLSSAVAVTGTSLFWVGGRHHSKWLTCTTGSGRHFGLGRFADAMVFYFAPHFGTRAAWSVWDTSSVTSYDYVATHRFAGFGWARNSLNRSDVYIAVPYWAMLLIAMATGVRVIFAWRRGRRLVKSGCCRCCGYDLRATPDFCPECGMANQIFPPLSNPRDAHPRQ